MWRTTRDGLIPLEETKLWTIISYFGPKETLKDRLGLCGLLRCFYQLFGLSFWRHPFTTEDPLVSKWCNVNFLQICSDEETNSVSTVSWMTWGWVHFQQKLIRGRNIPLKLLNIIISPVCCLWLNLIDGLLVNKKKKNYGWNNIWAVSSLSGH